MFRPHQLACIALALLGATACDKKSEGSATTSPSSGATSAPPAAPSPSSSPPTSTAAPPEVKDDSSRPVVGPDAPPFKVVEKPSSSDVPATAVAGSANGHKFEPKAIFFEPDKKGWKLFMSDKALEKPTDFTKPGAQTIHLSLNTGKLAAGQKISKAMKSGDGFFQIATPDATKTTSWNTKNAYYVEITKWDLKPYDEKGNPFQQGGTASGKVYVVHEANDISKKGGFADSGVAGTFTDVVIRYRGQPKFED